MRKVTTFLLIVGLLTVAATVFAEKKERDPKEYKLYKAKLRAHHHDHKEENKAYRDSLKDLTPEERAARMKEHRAKQYENSVSFRRQIHKERMDQLKKKLADNKRLSDAQKEELINFYDRQYQEASEHREQQYEENAVFFEKIANDPNLSMEQKKAAFKEQRAAQRIENKAFHKEQKGEKKEIKKKFHSETKKPKDSEEKLP